MSRVVSLFAFVLLPVGLLWGCARQPDYIATHEPWRQVDESQCLQSGYVRESRYVHARSALFDLYGLPMSVGAIVDSQAEVSEALAAPFVEIVEHAQAAPIKNADETSWIEGKGKKAKAWLWALVTTSAVVFMIQKSRATGAAMNLLLNGKTLVGDLAFGVLGTDRHGAYNFWPLALRQFCGSHLTRDLRSPWSGVASSRGF